MKINYHQLDKQIYYVKIIIWEGCPLRCSYCFVDKENNRAIEISTLEKLIELLMYTPWHNKLLHLLGGEPLMYFDTIKYGIEYARKLEKETGKLLDISFCTSGVWFTQERLDFIRDNQIYLAWSIDGTKRIHDMNRTLLGWKWSYDMIIRSRDMVINSIQDTHLGIAMTVNENAVEYMYDSYLHLVEELGFRCTVNIAPVDGKIWPIAMQKKWVTELVRIYEYIIQEIGKWNFLYLNAFNKEFKFHMISSKNTWRCLWFYTEAFTNGDVLFNPFVNKQKDYSRYVVANINDEDFLEKVQKYIWCRFDTNSPTCISCKESYFWDNTDLSDSVQMNRLLSYRDRITEQYANKIRLLAKTHELYAQYMEKSKNYMHV
jgi:sulfatase maturation enzyme AslB (radical SAM superfamily)